LDNLFSVFVHGETKIRAFEVNSATLVTTQMANIMPWHLIQIPLFTHRAPGDLFQLSLAFFIPATEVFMGMQINFLPWIIMEQAAFFTFCVPGEQYCGQVMPLYGTIFHFFGLRRSSQILPYIQCVCNASNIRYRLGSTDAVFVSPIPYIGNSHEYIVAVPDNRANTGIRG
jgi:hypothetical protein